MGRSESPSIWLLPVGEGTYRSPRSPSPKSYPGTSCCGSSLVDRSLSTGALASCVRARNVIGHRLHRLRSACPERARRSLSGPRCSSMPRKLCVIKEGRPHGETDWLGRDGFIRLKREAQVLRSTGTTAVPRVLRTFRANGCYYLVMERICGKSLQQVLASRQRMSTRRMLDYCAQMARIVADIHTAGWAWRDCKPDNFLVDKDHKLRGGRFRRRLPTG